MKQKRIEKIIVFVVLGLLSLVLALQCPNNIINHGVRYSDQSVFEYIARCMLEKGQMPYRDIFDHKGPLIFIYYVVGLLISKSFGLWLLEFVNLCIFFYLTYKLSMLVSKDTFISVISVFIAGALLVVYYEGGGLVESYALPYIAGALYIFTDYFINDRITTLRLLVCGFCFGAVCLLRVNMVAVWAVMCIAVLVVCIIDKRIKDLFRFLLFFLTGAALIVVPVFAWLIAKDSFRAFIKCYWTFNVWYSTQDNATFGSKVSAFNWFLDAGIMLVALGLLCFKVYKERKRQDIIFLVLMIVNLLLTSMSGNQFGHYGMVIVPIIVYPYADGLMWIREEKKERTAYYLILGYVLVAFACSPWLSAVSETALMYDTKDESLVPEIEVNVCDVINEYVKPGDEIIVCGDWACLYNMTGTYSASYYAYQNWPCKDKSRLKRFKADIMDKEPAVLVMTETRCTVKKTALEIVDAKGYEEVYTETGTNSKLNKVTVHVYVKKGNSK